MRSVALDLGTKKTTFCEVQNGVVVQRASVSEFSSLRALVGPDQPQATIAIEACREAWHAYEVLSGWGNEVLLVDTTRSKQVGIGHHGRKTDRLDAEVLARAVERGGLPKAHLLSAERRVLRRLLGVRKNLINTRSTLIVVARGLAREMGQPLPGCDTESFVSRARVAPLSDELRVLLEPLLAPLESVNQQLAKVEEELTRLAQQEPVIQLLCTAPGVGPLVAAVFVSVVDEARRFKRAHQLESYLGLVPGEYSSGGNKRVGAITKKGNSYLRSMLMQAAWVIVRKRDMSDPLTRWGNTLLERRGKKVGVVAVARKLAGVLWAMWKNGTVYDAELLRKGSIRGLEQQAQDAQYRAQALKEASRKTSGKFSVQEVHS